MSQASERRVSGGFSPVGEMTPQGARETDGAAREWRFSATDGAQAHIALLASDIVRVRLLPPGVAPATSWAVARAEWPAVSADVHTEAPGFVRLATDALAVEVATAPLRLAFRWPNGDHFAEDDETRGMGAVASLDPSDLPDPRTPPGSLRCYKRLGLGERILGAGERTEPLDKRGYRILFWNTDPPHPHALGTGAMYSSLPFWTVVRPDGRAWGVFLDSAGRADLDAGASDPELMSFGVVDGDLTYYLFAGPTPADVLRQYSELTGRMPMPPRWALGFGQSRWSYFPEAQLREVAQGFRNRRIPCDHLWLDIDYMDGYRVFTWNPTRFPQPKAMLDELSADGFKVVAIIDPGVKADPTDATFAEGVERDYFVRHPDGSLFIGSVWPGASVFADFSRADVRAWWGERHRALMDAGLAGIWDDMNEPGLTEMFAPGSGSPHGSTMAPDAIHRPQGPDGPTLPHTRFHNAFGMQMARATREGLERLRPNERAFVLTRSGYAGVQRYAAMWTGDNSSRWEHLRLAVSMCLSVGMSGQPFIGFDSGGFFDAATPEMLVRFMQLGVFFPLYRNHSAMGTPAQEPWAFGQPWEAFCRDAINLRYRLLPYLYTRFEEASRTGAPITRPMAYAFPDDAHVAGLEDQFLVGADLLAAPALLAGQLRRDVRFPVGAWRDWLTGERYAGPLTAQVETPIDAAPLFVREGAIVPLGPVMQYVGEVAEESLTLVCALGPEDGARAQGELYEDDGATRDFERGAWSRTRFTAERSGQRVTVRAERPEGPYRAARGVVTVELRLPRADLAPRAARPEIRAATVDGLPLEGVHLERVERRYETLLRATLGQVDAPFTVEIELA
ncbi:MAG TPA: TIM-barrel domain-containing protein [Ktedonobacterales bacterium]